MQQEQFKRIVNKQEKLEKAKQGEKKPNPQGQHKFSEEDVIDFNVNQEGKMIKLHTYRYHPFTVNDQGEQVKVEQIKALIIMFHGLNSYLGHGSHVAHEFAKNGFCVVGFDHRGFGKSQGQKGYIESIDQHLRDSKTFVGLIEQIYGNQIPKFLMGLSMGGMTSYRLSLEEPERYQGAILMAPAIKSMASGFLKGLANIAGSLIPKWNIIKQKRGLASKNPQITEDNMNDPHIYADDMYPNTGKVILNAMDQAEKTFNKYKSPFIIVQGGLDKLVDPDVGYILMEQSQSQDKEKMWHDIWHEDEIDEITQKVINWAQKRVK